jgi:hypothetical protein
MQTPEKPPSSRKADSPSIVKKVPHSLYINKVISAAELWSNKWREQNTRTKQTPPSSPTKTTHPNPSSTPHPHPSTFHEPTKSNLSPTSPPFIPKHHKSLPSTVLSPTPQRSSLAFHAERLLGRFTPDTIHTDPSDEDWSTKISHPVTLLRSSLPSTITGLKVALYTYIYSPHPLPSDSPQGYSRITLIDMLDSPTLTPDDQVRWCLPARGVREFDNRLYFPAKLAVHTEMGVVDVAEAFTYIGDGRFWAGGFVVEFSSRRVVSGDVVGVKGNLGEELACIVGVEVELGDVERWLGRMGRGDGGRDFGRVGQFRDESSRGVRRELPREMFV